MLVFTTRYFSRPDTYFIGDSAVYDNPVSTFWMFLCRISSPLLHSSNLSDEIFLNPNYELLLEWQLQPLFLKLILSLLRLYMDPDHHYYVKQSIKYWHLLQMWTTFFFCCIIPENYVWCCLYWFSSVPFSHQSFLWMYMVGFETFFVIILEIPFHW